VSAWWGGGRAAEAHEQAPGAVAPVDVEAVGFQRLGRERDGRGAEPVGIVAAAQRGDRARRERVQPDGDADDQPQRPERPREQLGEVVARDVLDHLAARAGERPVRQRDRRADDEVAHAPVAVAQRAGVAGRDHAADRGRRAVPERGVDREHLPVLGERGLRLGQRHAGLQHRGEVAHVVLEQPVHAARL
jgi:hypothetical protein